MYVIKNMKKDYQKIINWLEDDVQEKQFLNHLINHEYKQAFKLCCNLFVVHSNIEFMINIINWLDPNVNKNWSEYRILEETNKLEERNKLEDRDMFDDCLLYECEQFRKLPNIIFN